MIFRTKRQLKKKRLYIVSYVLISSNLYITNFGWYFCRIDSASGVEKIHVTSTQ
jgi:hypothetical protein